MPAYLFVDAAAQDQNRQPGEIDSFTLYFPGNVKAAIAYAKAQGLGGAHKRFTVYDANSFGREPKLLTVQRFLGQVEDGRAPQLSRQHVGGGQPTGAPRGQNQGRPSAPRDEIGKFQELGDEALDIGGPDGMFGPGPGEGAYNDIINEGGAVQEVPRK